VGEGQGLKQIRPLAHPAESEAPMPDHGVAITSPPWAYSGSMRLIPSL
jgi:hypothetical protein